MPKRFGKLLALALLLSGVASWAQTQVGCFRIQPDTVGCAPLFVNVANCYIINQPVAYNFSLNLTPNAWYQANVSNGGDTSFTYSQPGKFTLGQGISGQFRNAFRRNIRVFSSGTTPQFALSGCDEQLVILIKDSLFTRMRFEIDGQIINLTRSRSDTVLRVPISVSNVSKKIEVKAIGLYPTNCGNTARIDSAVIYKNNAQLPVIELIYDVSSSPESLQVTINQRANTNYNFTYNCGIDKIRFLSKQVPSQAIAIDTAFSLPCSNGIFAVRQMGLCPNLASDSINFFKPEVKESGDSILIRSNLGGPITTLLIDNLPMTRQTAPYLTKTIAPSGCNKQIIVTSQDTLQTIFWFSSIQIFRPSGSTLAAKLIESSWFNEQPYFTYILNSEPQLATTASTCYSTIVSGDTLRVIGSRCSTPPICHLTTATDNCSNQIVIEDCPVFISTKTVDDCLELTWNAEQLQRVDCKLLEVRNGIQTSIATGVAQTGKYETCGIDTLDVELTYCIKCDSLQGQPFVKSNLARFIKQFSLQLPNAFTPNGDGENDLFSIKKMGYQLSLTIFNFWGESVYSNTAVDIVEWTGLFKNTLAPAGNYIAKISASREGNQVFNRSQVISLIR